MAEAAEKQQPQSMEITAYKPFWEELGRLKEDNKKLVFQYHTPKGNKEARSHVYNLRKRKADIERTRKAEKQEALEWGRQVDKQAKEIIAEYEEMIRVHQEPLDEIERKEQERVDAHKEKISFLAYLAEVDEEEELTADHLQGRLDKAQGFVIDESLEEFQQEAEKTKAATIERLEKMLASRRKYEAEQAELARLRKEQEERERKEHEERIAREAAERAKREAEEQAKREREEAERAARAEREEAERKAKMEREAAERRERELREEAERAKREAKEAEERARREAEEQKRREQEEAERREANKRHCAKVNNAAVKALTDGGVEKEQAKLAITLIAKREVPAVTISY